MRSCVVLEGNDIQSLCFLLCTYRLSVWMKKIFGFISFSENVEQTFTLSEAVEAIGMGKFQILLILMAGFVNVSLHL